MAVSGKEVKMKDFIVGLLEWLGMIFLILGVPVFVIILAFSWAFAVNSGLAATLIIVTAALFDVGWFAHINDWLT